MRGLLAPLTRWLDRRIDARIAARVASKPLPAGHQQLADFAANAIRDAAAVSPTAKLNINAGVILDDALHRYGGPCVEAYADVLNGYISAPPGGRDALFLAVAYRAVGTSSPSPTPMTDQADRASAETSFRRPRKLPRLLRAFRRLSQQARS